MDVDAARTRLTAERAEVTLRLSRLSGDYDAVVDASRDSNADDEHDPEGATIAFERSQIGVLVRQARKQLGEIEAAMDRLEAGSYGTCENCGDRIAEGRLEARPTARRCITCTLAG